MAEFKKQHYIIGIFTALAIMLFYLSFNFNFLSKWIDERRDSLTYYNLIKRGDARALFNPHHIGFDWLGVQFYNIVVKNAYTGSLMHILQLRNLIISSICLGIGFYFFYRYSKKYFLSLIQTGLMAFSCAIWIYSQINDTGIIHSMLIFIFFFVLMSYPFNKKPLLFSSMLGVFHGVVIFFHQSDGVFILVVSFIILFGDLFPPKNNSLDVNKKPLKLSRKFLYLLVYLVVFFLIIAFAYYYVAIILMDLTFDPETTGYFNSVKGSDYFFYWLILYSNFKSWGKGYEQQGLFDKALKGISTYFYQPGTIENKTIKADFQSRDIQHLLPNMLFILTIVVLASSIFLFKPLLQKSGYIYLAALLFLLSYSIFALWWEPDYREFWIAPMNAFWILAFIVINFLLDRFKSIKPIPESIIYSFLLLIIFMLFIVNFKNLIYPNAGNTFRSFDIPQAQLLLEK